MADTTDRSVVHYMFRRQHPERADSLLLEFLAPAIAIKLAVTKEEWDKFVRLDPAPATGIGTNRAQKRSRVTPQVGSTIDGRSQRPNPSA